MDLPLNTITRQECFGGHAQVCGVEIYGCLDGGYGQDDVVDGLDGEGWSRHNVCLEVVGLVVYTIKCEQSNEQTLGDHLYAVNADLGWQL
jgi:hypothetical protein